MPYRHTGRVWLPGTPGECVCRAVTARGWGRLKPADLRRHELTQRCRLSKGTLTLTVCHRSCEQPEYTAIPL